MNGQENSDESGDVVSVLTPPLMVVGGFEVRNFIATPAKIVSLWQELEKYPSLFSDWSKGDFSVFSNIILAPDSIWLEIGDVGLLYATDIVEGVSASVHAIFFDRSVADKVDVCRELIKWLFAETSVHRLSADVPIDYYATKRLLTKLGFRYEGTRRESVLRRGKWVDIVLYGLTLDEGKKIWAD